MLIYIYIYIDHFVLCRYPFTPDQPVSEAEWEIYLRETAAAIVEQQNPKRYRTQNHTASYYETTTVNSFKVSHQRHKFVQK